MISEDTMDADAPGLESNDGRGINVDYQGEHHLNHYGDVVRFDKARKEQGISGNDLDGRHHDTTQVND